MKVELGHLTATAPACLRQTEAHWSALDCWRHGEARTDVLCCVCLYIAIVLSGIWSEPILIPLRHIMVIKDWPDRPESGVGVTGLAIACVCSTRRFFLISPPRSRWKHHRKRKTVISDVRMVRCGTEHIARPWFCEQVEMPCEFYRCYIIFSWTGYSRRFDTPFNVDHG